MGFEYDTKDTPDFISPGKDYYDVTVESLTYIGGTPEDARPLWVDINCRIDEPRRWGGKTLKNRFFLGTAEDPMAKDPTTRKSDMWTNYKRMFRACDLTWTGRIDDDAQLIKGQKLTVFNSPNDKGFSRLKDFYKLGTKEAGALSARDFAARKSSPATTGPVVPRRTGVTFDEE